MIPIFEQEYVVVWGMAICFVVSIMIRIFLGMLYQRIIQETDNMAITENKLLKQCKLKFSNCFQLNNGVANVPVFVEKFLNRLAIGPFSFRVLYDLSGQLMLLSIIFCGIGVYRSIVAGCMFGEILPFYICSLLELYLYFSTSAMVDLKGKRKILKINLIDYLENHLSNRMNLTRADMSVLYGNESQGQAQKSLELIPIAGWLAEKDEKTARQNQEQENAAAQRKREEIGLERTRLHAIKDNSDAENLSPIVEFEEGEAEALEELLKEFLSMS